MDKLQAAVRAGIITQAQRDAIEALEAAEPRAFRLSVVHVLWAGGVALVVFALVLLAAQVSQGEVQVLMWVCLVYAAGLTWLDRIVSGRAGLRLLSCLVVAGIAVCLSLAVLAWQEVMGGHASFVPWDSTPYAWRREGATPALPFHPLIHGVVPVMVPVLALSAVLIWKRGFLPVWLALAFCFVTLLLEVQQGAGVPVDEAHVFLGATVLMAGFGWWCDLWRDANHGFWINKAAMLCFWIYAVLALVDGATVLLLVSSLGAILFSVFIRRPAGISAGALGLALFLGDWFDAWDELYTAAALLAVIGLGAIALGVKAHLIEDRLEAMLPEGLARLRPAARDDPVTFGF